MITMKALIVPFYASLHTPSNAKHSLSLDLEFSIFAGLTKYQPRLLS